MNFVPFDWLQRYRVRYFLRTSAWIVPMAALVAAFLVFLATRRIDLATRWQGLGLTSTGAQAVVGSLTAALLSFIVFVFSAVMVAVQIASAQLTPRIIAGFLQDRAGRGALAIFVFAFVYSVLVLARVESEVPQLCVLMVGVNSILCVCVFLIFIDHVGKALRPIAILTNVAASGRREILAVYPYRLEEGRAVILPEPLPQDSPPRLVAHAGPAGVLLAVDLKGLLEIARQSDCIVEMVCEVGQFVAVGDTLFRVYGGTGADVRGLQRTVAMGPERTLQQDPCFALRIVVDIASKALSPAINDPTTAVLALDQIHHLLHEVGQRHLDPGHIRDAGGRLRLVYPTPDWEDFVGLSLTEIRQYGRDSIQIARRTEALLHDLIRDLPPLRIPRLEEELDLLHRSVERNFPDPEDRRRALKADRLGLGGVG